MMEIIKNNFIHSVLEDDLVIYKLKTIHHLSQEEFIKLFEFVTENLLRLSQESKIRGKSLRVLVDNSEAIFITSNQTQAYIDKHLFPKLIPLTKKLAYLLSRDFYSRELLLDEYNARKFNTKYFFDKKDALEWLKNDSIYNLSLILPH